MAGERKSLLKRIEWLLFKLEEGLLLLALGVLVGLSFFQVLLFNLSQVGFTWAGDWSLSMVWGDRFLRHLVIVIAFLGATLATREGRHLNIDAMTRLFPARVKVIIKAVIDLISSVVCLLLAKATWDMIAILRDSSGEAFKLGSFVVADWVFCYAIFSGFTLIAVRFVIRGGQDFWGGWTGNVEPEPPPVGAVAPVQPQ